MGHDRDVGLETRLRRTAVDPGKGRVERELERQQVLLSGLDAAGDLVLVTARSRVDADGVGEGAALVGPG